MPGKYWTINPQECLPIRMGDKGVSAWPARTVGELFESALAKNAAGPAMAVKETNSTEWKTWTWQQYYDDCLRFAATLLHLGVEIHSVVNIVGFNHPSWFIANNGSILAGCIAAGIYTTNSPEACLYVTQHSEARVVVVEDNKQLQKYTSCTDLASRLPHLKVIVMYSEEADEALVSSLPVPVYSFQDFLRLGEGGHQETALESRNRLIMPGHCALLIYTSGTTGAPKGAMISHDNLTWSAKNIMESYVETTSCERIVSYLPLSHIAAQIIDNFGPMAAAACTYFAQADALKGPLTTTLKEARPTIFFAVPRVWEKIQEKMVAIGRETTGVKKMISTWAKSMGTAQMKASAYGESGIMPWGYGCANAMVLSKIKEALGLDAAKLCAVGAAPIAVETLEYFGSLGINVYEGFGQSECSGLYTINAPGAWKLGTCGRPCPGTRAKIDSDTGELCYTGRNVFMGYLGNAEKTQETIDDEGFLHSGDVAVFDDDDDPRVPSPSGFLTITGRIKELIITAGGENISPVSIESEMKLALPELSTCLVIGDRRKFLSMLVSLKVQVDPDTGEPTDFLAEESLQVSRLIGSRASTLRAAAEDLLWQNHITEGMKAANKKATSNAQVVQKWRMLPADLSERAGDLTPTLKIKRSSVYEKYSDLIESMY